MHFLCFKETQTLDAVETEDASSYQLAQSDFAERHLCNWVSELAEKAIQQQPAGIYPRLLVALSEFVVKDYEWQAGTIK
jgi:TorA maturation chaperone TorD